MHSLVSILAFVVGVSDPWERTINSVHLDRSRILTPADSRRMQPEQLKQRVEMGAVAIVEGGSEHAKEFGIHPTPQRVNVRSVVDLRNARLQIVWEKPLETAVFKLPENATIFAKERWTDAPLLAGIRRGKGGVLWAAAPPGDRGYERFPYAPQALADLHLRPQVEARDLWAFFDSSYRARADLDYLAAQWRRGGISALHVAAWHYNELDADRDAYLKRLIEACHRHGIAVYAWLELPHVSDRFWDDHPEWREKTAIGQDAHLDWRRLMNLQNAECAEAVALAIRGLIARFDWDGVNLAELYFESLEGAANLARFTPFNEDVRRAFAREHGEDPIDVVRKAGSPLLPKFLEFRAVLAKKMQEQWIEELERIRRVKPHLDIVLTHVDDRFDQRMRELIGADSTRVMPLVERHDITFLIEDPATIWHLGPERYTQIAEQYRPVAQPQRLAIDINIVERYQDVYPTKQQTGGELFQLVNVAAGAFPRVALYFENSILKPDWPLLASAAATVRKLDRTGAAITIETDRTVRLRWKGPAKVNGKIWPVQDREMVWLPPGRHHVEAGVVEPVLQLKDLNAQLISAEIKGESLQFRYASQTRALATFTSRPGTVVVDGEALEVEGPAVMLPRGTHTVVVNR